MIVQIFEIVVPPATIAGVFQARRPFMMNHSKSNSRHLSSGATARGLVCLAMIFAGAVAFAAPMGPGTGDEPADDPIDVMRKGGGYDPPPIDPNDNLGDEDNFPIYPEIHQVDLDHVIDAVDRVARGEDPAGFSHADVDGSNTIDHEDREFVQDLLNDVVVMPHACDLNIDGSIDIADVAIISSFVIQGWKAGDLDLDGDVDQDDADLVIVAAGFG